MKNKSIAEISLPIQINKLCENLWTVDNFYSNISELPLANKLEFFNYPSVEAVKVMSSIVDSKLIPSNNIYINDYIGMVFLNTCGHQISLKDSNGVYILIDSLINKLVLFKCSEYSLYEFYKQPSHKYYLEVLAVQRQTNKNSFH